MARLWNYSKQRLRHVFSSMAPVVNITRRSLHLEQQKVIIRPIKRQELCKVLNIFDEVLPIYDNPCLEMIYELDPGSFICAELEDSREMIGCITGLIVNNTYAIGSGFVVKEEFRFKGVGTLLKKARRGRLGERNLSIFSALEREKFNLKSGLCKHSVYPAYLLKGRVNPRAIKQSTDISEITIVPFVNSKEDFDAVVQYDEKIASFKREIIFKLLMNAKNSFTYIARNLENAIVGFIHLHPIRGGFRIYPWTANSNHVAMLLFNEICKHIKPDDTLFVDSQQRNKMVAQIKEEHQWEELGGIIFMCSHEVPPIDVDRMYACGFAGLM